MISDKDFKDLINSFAKRAIKETFTGQSVEYETTPFRQPELYGLPIFVIGYGGRTVAYVGQYIAHKVLRVRIENRVENRWRILTGFVRIFARHVENEGIILEVFSNGIPSAGIAEYMQNRDKYYLIEDRKELNEIECREEDIINLHNVMNYEDPVLLIDLTGTLRDVPSHILTRYVEIMNIYRTLQHQLFEQEKILDDLKLEIESTKAENRTLRTHIKTLNTRLLAISGTLMHYKSELLKMKELLMFYAERLEAVKEGKEKLRTVINDFYDFMDEITPIIEEVKEKIELLDSLRRESEKITSEIERVAPTTKKEEKKGGKK